MAKKARKTTAVEKSSGRGGHRDRRRRAAQDPTITSRRSISNGLHSRPGSRAGKAQAGRSLSTGPWPRSSCRRSRADRCRDAARQPPTRCARYTTAPSTPQNSHDNTLTRSTVRSTARTRVTLARCGGAHCRGERRSIVGPWCSWTTADRWTAAPGKEAIRPPPSWSPSIADAAHRGLRILWRRARVNRLSRTSSGRYN